MTRLIDADALVLKIESLGEKVPIPICTEIINGFQGMVKEAPTIEPSGDLISRADAITEFREWVKRANENGETPTWNDAVSLIGSLPSAEQVISKLNNPCDSLLTDESNGSKEHKSKLDLISRADAIKAIRKCKFESDMPSYWYRGMEDAQDIIENIPSAELPKGDLISRKVLMDRLESFCKWCKDGRLQGAEFVWDCIVPNVPSADVIHSGGVFVPNMEMPEACDYCLFHDSGWSWCKAKDKYCGDDKCPLIAVRGERREP